MGKIGPMLLSKCEIRALNLVAQGYTAKEAAEIMEVKKRTVDFHLGGAYKKLGVTSRMLAVNKARALGIIPDPEWPVKAQETARNGNPGRTP